MVIAVGVAAALVAFGLRDNLDYPRVVSYMAARGEAITAKLTTAPGNGAPLGGLKVTTENAWFAARPSGTEDVYKIYAESFAGEDHLRRIQSEARELVGSVVGA